METLFNKRCYQLNNSEYNNDYIVQLEENYRSHPSILDFANKLFYDNLLLAAAKKDVTDWFIGSNLLPNPAIPVVFDSINGVCKRDNRSSYNVEEKTAVVKWLQRILNFEWYGRKILPADIGIQYTFIQIMSGCHCKNFSAFFLLFFLHILGIVSPYRAQCEMIKVECEHKNIPIGSAGITIGTAEVFQGQERAVVIVSTVRTDKQLGFVSDHRVGYLIFLPNIIYSFIL